MTLKEGNFAFVMTINLLDSVFPLTLPVLHTIGEHCEIMT
jgi:hypothetical protein